MRQRILIAVAILLAITLGYRLLKKAAQPSSRLTMVSIPSLTWTYACNVKTTIQQKDQEPQSRELISNFTFKGRTSRGSQRFENVVNFSSSRMLLNGEAQKASAQPMNYYQVPRDLRARPIVDGFADLYPFEMLNTPLMFPFLSGQSTDAGLHWQDQFRIVLPWDQQQIIVIMDTKLEDARTSREAKISYKMRGEAFYAIDRDRDPKTPDVKEKAVLTLSGSSTMDPKVGLPLEQAQEMTLEAFDYDMIRNLKENAATDFARTIRIESRMSLKVSDKGNVFETKETPDLTPTPTEDVEEMEPEF